MKLIKLLVASLLLTAAMSASAVIKPWCYWTIGVVGDGVTTQQTLNLISDPFSISPAQSIAGSVFTFKVSSTVLPTGMDVIASSDGQTVTPSLGLLGNITLSWPIPIPNGDKVTVFGRLTF